MKLGWLALLVVGGALVVAIAARDSDADVDGGTFTSSVHNVRATLPRGWRISDQATFPGVILRMFRTRPRATILVAVDQLVDARARVDASCKTGAIEVQIACHQTLRLAALGFETGAIKEAARPWFDYGDDKRQLRQGVAVIGGRVFTVVLAADTTASRAQYARTFDKILRSLRRHEAEGATTMPGDAPSDGGVPQDGGLDAGVAP
jgi:hypothetical protein